MRDYVRKNRISGSLSGSEGGFRDGEERGVRLPSFRRRHLLWLLFWVFLATVGGSAGRYYWREMRWRYIVVHHTASDHGNLEYYRNLHMEEHGWPDIAYHFLINNGSYNTTVGQIEQSDLWVRRDINYSTKVSWINYFAVAVVMVGNFEEHEVPGPQREALVNLLTRLAREYEIPPERIVGHREIWATACPGKYLNMVEIRESVRRNLGRSEKSGE